MACALAMTQGYGAWKQMRDDRQLGSLRDEPRFKALFPRVLDVPALVGEDEDIPF